MTPFQQGQQAARDGQPKESNPFPKQIIHGDDYPGPWGNWHMGWINETGIIEHDEARS